MARKSSRSSKPSGRGRSRRKSSRGGRSADRWSISSPWPWLVVSGFLLVIGGLGLLGWTRTPAGQAAMLGMGAKKFHGVVQESLDEVLVLTLGEGHEEDG